jgi:hypothetical protein
MWCQCPSLEREVSGRRLGREDRSGSGGGVGGSPCRGWALSVSEYRAGLAAAGFRDISMTLTHEVGDGLYSAIVKATRPADAVAASTARGRVFLKVVASVRETDVAVARE